MEEEFYEKIEKLEDFCQNIEKDKNLSNIEPIISLKYINLQDSLPFDFYFKNFLYQILIRTPSIKRVFLKSKNISNTFNIIEELNCFMEKFPKKAMSINLDNKEKENNQKVYLQKTTENNNKSNLSKNKTNKSIENIHLLKMEKLKEYSNIDSYYLNKQNKDLDKIKEGYNKFPHNNRINYFDVTNKMKGDSFEYSTIKYIFELLNCISKNNDFHFYTNIKPDVNKINRIFKEHKINTEIKDIQIDFCIYNLLFTDFVNLIIYLSKNIFNYSKLKSNIFNHEITYSKLLDIKNEKKYAYLRVDIIGEIGTNIYNEGNLIKQIEKYEALFKNIDIVKEESESDINILLNTLQMKNYNKEKIVLFLTNNDFDYFYNEKDNNAKLNNSKYKNDKKDLQTIQKEYKINSLVLFINNNNNYKENILIEKLNSDYSLISSYKNDFIDYLISEKNKKLNSLILPYRTKKFAKKLDYIEEKMKLEDILSKFIESNKILLNKIMTNELLNVKNDFLNRIKVNTANLDKYKIQENPCSKSSNKNNPINVVIFVENSEPQIKIKEDKNIKIFKFVYPNKKDYKLEDIDKEYQLFLDNNKSEFDKLLNNLGYNLNIIVFIANGFNKQDSSILKQFFKNVKMNYLSYLLIFDKNYNNNSFEKPLKKIRNVYIDKENIKTMLYPKSIEESINEFIKAISQEYKLKWQKLNSKKEKYIEIIQSYNKYYKDKILELNQTKKLTNLNDILEEQKRLLRLKIKQDFLFYLTLNIIEDNNNYYFCDVNKINVEVGKEKIEDFLSSNDIIIEINNIFSKFKKENNRKTLNYNLTQKEIDEYLSVSKSLSNQINMVNDYFFENKENGNDFVNLEKEINIDIDCFTQEIKNYISFSLSLLIMKMMHQCFNNIITVYLKKQFIDSLCKDIVSNKNIKTENNNNC